jgi:uncharacterized protein
MKGEHGMPRLSRYLVATEPFEARGQRARIALSTRSGESTLIADEIWDAVRHARWDDVPDTTLAALRRMLIVVSEDDDELALVIADNQREIAQSQTLVQIVQPTAACQLGCSYCGQQHQAHTMTEAVRRGLVDKVRRRLARGNENGDRYEVLRIGWFGAEPLLGLSAMRALTPELRAAADEAGCQYTARIVTNGIGLSLPIARELQASHGVGHVEITLDGPARTHDLRRVTKNGAKPTFEAILRRLSAIAGELDITFDVTIRCNVDRSNADAVDELIEVLDDRGLSKRVGLYFAPVHDWGNGAHETALDPKEFAEREVAWFAQMLRRGFDVDLIPARRPIVCMAVRPDARLTDAYGTEFNCSEVSYVPAYGEPSRYATGHVDATEERVDHFADFNAQVLASEDSWCHHCPMLPVCGGSCPKSWADGIPPCPSFKQNAEERLLLDFASKLQRAVAVSGTA